MVNVLKAIINKEVQLNAFHVIQVVWLVRMEAIYVLFVKITFIEILIQDNVLKTIFVEVLINT